MAVSDANAELLLQATCKIEACSAVTVDDWGALVDMQDTGDTTGDGDDWTLVNTIVNNGNDVAMARLSRSPSPSQAADLPSRDEVRVCMRALPSAAMSVCGYIGTVYYVGNYLRRSFLFELFKFLTQPHPPSPPSL